MQRQKKVFYCLNIAFLEKQCYFVVYKQFVCKRKAYFFVFAPFGIAKSGIKFLASRALFLACFLPCTSRSRGKHSRRLVCLRSHVLRAYCNFESKQTISSTLFGRRSNNEFPSIYLLKRLKCPFKR